MWQESAVPKFFELRRKLDADFSSTTRNALDSTVLDAWIN
jgi:hypothetical protein